MKYYYSNLVANQNFTAKSNTVWVADITEIKLDKTKKFYVFLVIDIYSNKVIEQASSQKTIRAQAIVNYLKRSINSWFVLVTKIKAILHTDSGTRFSSEHYNKFVNQFEQFIQPSMSRENIPTDNGVAINVLGSRYFIK